MSINQNNLKDDHDISFAEGDWSGSAMTKRFNTWNDIDWGIAREKVRKIQYRIYEESRNGNTLKRYTLQKRLLKNIYAKLLCVQQVTTLNKGRRSTGVDRNIVTTPKEKLNLAKNLKIDGKSNLIRRVWIEKAGKTERRPLGIPTIEDRAKQALAKLVLEPEWEAKFEASSYGFRPGRSAHDAMERIFTSMCKGVEKWIYDADIRKCFDKIDHEALITKLSTFPEMEKQIRAWLKAGVMEGYANWDKGEISRTEEGTPQEGVLSPLLANIALHGLEDHLKEFASKIKGPPFPGENNTTLAKRQAITVVRYADDFVVIHRNRALLESCIPEIHLWLKRVGLEISPDKSILRDGRQGFDFLGYCFVLVKRPNNYKTENDRYKIKIYPSRKSQKTFMEKVRQIIIGGKALSSYSLIEKLRPVIIGWGNYFRYCECKKVFVKLDNNIFQKLRSWVFRRDTKHGRISLRNKYFPPNQTYLFNGRQYADNWILVGKQKEKGKTIQENHLPRISWIKSEKHVLVKGQASPFDKDLSIYWNLRSQKYPIYPVTITSLLKKQKGKCKICETIFTSFDESSWEIDHIVPKSIGGKDQYKNLQLIHKSCHLKKSAGEQKRIS